MKSLVRFCVFALATLVLSFALPAQSKRKVIIDQDAAGPGGTDMQAILCLVNSPDTEVLGITVVTGDAWRDSRTYDLRPPWSAYCYSPRPGGGQIEVERLEGRRSPRPRRHVSLPHGSPGSSQGGQARAHQVAKWRVAPTSRC